jgi:hypothetical protein
MISFEVEFVVRISCMNLLQSLKIIPLFKK